jgi:hypothetical protein
MRDLGRTASGMPSLFSISLLLCSITVRLYSSRSTHTVQTRPRHICGSQRGKVRRRVGERPSRRAGLDAIRRVSIPIQTLFL